MAAVVKKMQCRFTQHGNVCTNHTEAHHQQYYHPVSHTTRKPCNYAGECTSSIVKHRHEYAHPGDRDWPVIPMPRVPCRDAEHCSIHHVPLHRLRFSHPRDRDWPKPPLPAVPSSTRGRYQIGNYVATQGSQFGYVRYVEEKPDGFYYHVDINEPKLAIVHESLLRLQSRWPHTKKWVALARGVPVALVPDSAAAAAVEQAPIKLEEQNNEEMVHAVFSEMPKDVLLAIMKRMGVSKRRKRNTRRKKSKGKK
jgi:hypothetical protein